MRAILSGIELLSTFTGLGDLAREVETSYGDRSLARFAEDIGVPYSTLRRYRDVANAFPEYAPRGAYSVARELAALDDRFELVNEVSTVKEARAKVRERLSTFTGHPYVRHFHDISRICLT